MIKIILVSLILSASALAQTKTKVTRASVPVPTPAPLATPAPAPVAVMPWIVDYFGEYQGPSVGNISIGRTTFPGKEQGYTEWDHYLKLGYKAAKNLSVGTQIRAFSPTDPAASFGFYDLRFFSQWSHMIETSDIDMSSKLSVELPTTDASRTAGKIVALKFDQNFTLKTSLRNWSFTGDLQVRPIFYNDPVGGGGKTDLLLGFFPYITVDLWPNVQLLFEGSFDATHNYTAGSFDLTPGDPDYLDIGPLITINSHLVTNLALRFFTDNVSFKAAAIYFSIEATL